MQSTGGSLLENVCYPHKYLEKYYNLYNIHYETICASEAVKSGEKTVCIVSMKFMQSIKKL